MMKATSLATVLRIFIIGPSVAVLLAFGIFYINASKQDFDNDLKQKAQSLAVALSSAIEINVRTKNIPQLNEQLKYIDQQNDGMNIQIIDNSGDVLATAGPRISDRHLTQRVPIFSESIPNVFAGESLGVESEQKTELQKIGYIVVTIEKEGFYQKRLVDILIALSIFAAFLSVVLYLANNYVSKMDTAIKTIIKTSVDNYRSKRFNIPYKTELSNEIAELVESKEQERLKIKEMFEQEHELRKKADAANIAKTQLLSHVSHEMKQPAAVAYGLIQMLLKKNSMSPNEIMYLEIVKRNIELNNRFISDLLMLADFESDFFSFKNEAFDIVELFNTVCGGFQVQAVEKSIDFSFQSTSECATIFLDQLRISEIFNNLLSNAVKYTPNGAISAKLSVFDNKDTFNIEFSVKDTGIGIEDHLQNKVFELFERVDISHTRKTQGKGIGLFMVKVLTSAMGGNVSLNSKLGEGTEVRVSFEAQKSEIINSQKTKLQDTVPPKNLTLVVDDYSDACMMFKAILEMIGNKVILCSSGEEAIEQYKKHTPNLVILDYSLPDITGAEVAMKIRSIEKETMKSALIVGCSSAGHSIQEDFFSAGINEFIEKPFEIHDLVKLTSSAKQSKQTNNIIKDLSKSSHNENQ